MDFHGAFEGGNGIDNMIVSEIENTCCYKPLSKSSLRVSLIERENKKEIENKIWAH